MGLREVRGRGCSIADDMSRRARCPLGHVRPCTPHLEHRRRLFRASAPAHSAP